MADVGCGFGASTVVLAQAYPQSSFVGYDCHEPSIVAARERARQAGVADRVSFEVAGAKTYDGRGFDLVAFFDCCTTWEIPWARRAMFDRRWPRTASG